MTYKDLEQGKWYMTERSGFSAFIFKFNRLICDPPYLRIFSEYCFVKNFNTSNKFAHIDIDDFEIVTHRNFREITQDELNELKVEIL